MNKLVETMQGGNKLVGYVVANDPDIDTTIKNVVALSEGGADVIEIGIPFSDPVADGPVIQRADLRALADGELPMDKVFAMVDEIHQETDITLVFLTYLNVVLQYGYDEFCHQCLKHGVSGLIIPDLPYEEQDELLPFIDKYDLALVPLVTLNSDDRIEKLVQHAKGFIYLVSSLGVTGERDEFSNFLSGIVQKIKEYTDVPVAIGFGIHSAKQASEMNQISDGVIIGSSFVRIVEEDKQDAPKRLKDYANEIKQAIIE
ncbi:Tryptophan synthase alpha chain [Apilactobacillus kunkeei]|uniref:tryptophan synthase subunit alpha n=1 Tax=Apilactobacillus kunkeei TaxID=148814 RepID=UPI0006CE7072|nr:tryptophan synthase subunit alpha [Apilactobacillus kunkeei]KPN83308.1 Tryptophan synthase alpha chain [Apilactobacillus kunkeei]